MSKDDFPAEEFAERLARVRNRIAAAGLDWFVAFHPVSIHWLTGSDAKSYQAFQCLIISARPSPLIIVTREAERAEYEADTLVDTVYGWGGPEPEDPVTVFARALGDLGVATGRVGMEVPAYYLHPIQYLQIRDVLGSALVGEPSNLIQDIKLTKSPREIAYIRDAARIADLAMAAFAQALSIGRSELQVSGAVQHAILEGGGGLGASTLNLVSGERAAFSHGGPTERRLRAGDIGNIEFGTTRRRYTATIGRQFSIGAPPPRVREIFSIVRAASDACRAAIRPGVVASVPHQAAKRLLAEAGFDRNRVHTTGYGLAPGFPPAWGEPVNMYGSGGHVLQAGMVLSIEPPVFIPEERIGVRNIDNVLVTETGCELLTRFPQDMIVVV